MPIVMRIGAEMLANSDWRARRGACIVLSLVSEGCGKHMLPHIPAITDALLMLLDDAEYHVRYMSIHCLGQLAQDLGHVHNKSNQNFQALTYKKV